MSFRFGEGREEMQRKLKLMDERDIRLYVIMELCCNEPAWWLVNACIGELKKRNQQKGKG